MSWRRKALLYLLLFSPMLLAGLVARYSGTLGYLTEQAQGQWRLIWRAKDISLVLQENALPLHLKRNLKDVEHIKTFSKEDLGLTVSNTYERIYLDDPPLTMWVVSATEPYAFREKIWDFPLVGSFPYKGFFNKNSALRELGKLKNEGYDTHLSTASGWSTLGWLPNPITLNMLKRPVGALANLIIHELTHNNLHVKDNAALNENIASFVGHEGAVLFLQQVYGTDAPETKEYLLYQQDHKLYVRHILLGMSRLAELYDGFTEDFPPEETKKEMKNETIACILKELNGLSFQSAHFKKRRGPPQKTPNNAFFMAHKNYYSDQQTLNEDFQKSQKTLAAYIQELKTRHK